MAIFQSTVVNYFDYGRACERQRPQRSEAMGLLAASVTGDCELPGVGSGDQVKSSAVLLSDEPSLQPTFF